MLPDKKQILITLLALAVLTAFNQGVLAQFIDPDEIDFFNYPLPGGTDLGDSDELTISVTLDINPPTPTSNEQVKATAIALGYDKRSAVYQWFINGQAQTPPTKGMDEFRFKAGSATGDSHRVKVIVTLPDGKVREAENLVKVIEVIMGVEYQTLIPPRYKGAALGGNGSTAKIWALPFGLGNGRDVEYRWFINNEKVEGGFDKPGLTFDVAGGKLSPVKVRLQLINAAQGINLQKQFVFKVWDEEIALYETEPGQTLDPNRMHAAAGRIIDNLKSLVAWPYHFNAAGIGSLLFEWRTNGQKAFNIKDNTVNLPGEISPKTHTIDVKVSNPSSLLERATLRAGIAPLFSE